MIPIIAVVGTSGSGKTTLVCRLIEELTRRGYRIATVKHHPGSFEIDYEGKDSFKHREAGACQTMVSSPDQLALMRRRTAEMTLEEIAATLVVDADLLLAEGFKTAPVPKIEVWRESQPDPTLCCTGDPHWIALVTDFPRDVEVPIFDLNWPDQVADFIEREYLKKGDTSPLTLTIDGRRVPLDPALALRLAELLRGEIAGLPGCEGAEQINLSCRRRP